MDVVMPKLSDTMEEGKILRWLKKPGDQVNVGDVLAEVETDKADMELEAESSGVLSKILVDEGGSAAVGEKIALLGDGGAAAAEVKTEARQAKPEAAGPRPETRPARAEAHESKPQARGPRPIVPPRSEAPRPLGPRRRIAAR